MTDTIMTIIVLALTITAIVFPISAIAAFVFVSRTLGCLMREEGY